MKRMIFLLVLLVTIASTTLSVLAQQEMVAPIISPPEPSNVPQTPTWSEPTSFLGLELGRPLTEQTGTIVECPTEFISSRSFIKMRDWTFKGFCYETKPIIGWKFWKTYNKPDIGVGYSMTLIVTDNVLQGALLSVGPLFREKFLALLIARYGEPHLKSVSTLQNRMGATFEGAVYSWSGPSVDLQFSEYGNTMDESSFTILRKAYLAEKSTEINESVQKNKDKL